VWKDPLLLDSQRTTEKRLMTKKDRDHVRLIQSVFLNKENSILGFSKR